MSRRVRITHPLVALGAVAVIGVYAAGYQRTRASAARFSDEPAMRRPAPALPQVRQEPRTPVVAAPVAGKPPSEAETASTQPPQGVQRSAKRAKTDPVKPPKPAPVAAAQPLAEPPQAAATELPPAQVTVPEPAPPPAPPKPEYRDGTYYGWGSSRHGDIQAGVQIEAGKISNSWIQQCLTRYPCSLISHLPGQVVSRQSPEVDYVSGATQSTNAFYYAVVEALAKAKNAR